MMVRKSRHSCLFVFVLTIFSHLNNALPARTKVAQNASNIISRVNTPAFSLESNPTFPQEDKLIVRRSLSSACKESLQNSALSGGKAHDICESNSNCVNSYVCAVLNNGPETLQTSCEEANKLPGRSDHICLCVPSYNSFDTICNKDSDCRKGEICGILSKSTGEIYHIGVCFSTEFHDECYLEIKRTLSEQFDAKTEAISELTYSAEPTSADTLISSTSESEIEFPNTQSISQARAEEPAQNNKSTPIPTKTFSPSSTSSPSPSPSPSSDSDLISTVIGFCIAVHHLDELGKTEMVFESDVITRVFCDKYRNCATPGHIVTWRKEPMMMKTYCSIVGRCKEKMMRVNSPKWRKGRRISSNIPALEFTSYSAMYESRFEEGILQGVVRLESFISENTI